MVTLKAEPKHVSAPAPDSDPVAVPAAILETRYGHPHAWRFLLMADLTDQAVRRPWGHALMAIGWVHLAFFLVCQAVYTAGVRAPVVSLSLWAAELFAVLVAMRFVAGRDWIRASPAIGLIVRVWITFLILSFNVATLNSLTGWNVDWFKLVWCTLSSFGFATMAWLFGLRLLIPAFQMYFTSLLMSRFPQWAYLIYAGSWCATLQYLGGDLMRRRSRIVAARSHRESATVDEPLAA
jgi:hypothetical protein